MRRIILLCSAGVSTSVLVRKMEQEAARLGYPCSVSFFPIDEAAEAVSFADVLMLAPQAKHMLGELTVRYPNTKFEVIPEKLYAAADADAILDLAQKAAGDY